MKESICTSELAQYWERTFGAGRACDVHGGVLLLSAPPKRTAATTKHVEHDTSTLAEAHHDQMAVWASSSIVPHLLGAVHGTLVRGYAPFLSTVHGPVLHIFISAGLGIFLGIEGVAYFADRLNDVTRVGRGRAAGEEVMVSLTFVGLEGFELWAVFELGAHSKCGGGVEKRRKRYPGYHRECGEAREGKSTRRKTEQPGKDGWSGRCRGDGLSQKQGNGRAVRSNRR